MAREVIIVGRSSGAARVSVKSQGSRVGYKAQEFGASFESGYLNALELVTMTLEQAVEGGIDDITIFTLSNVSNAVARYNKIKGAVKILKLEEQEEMEKTFELFVEGKSTEMSQEEQELWGRFIPADFAAREENLLKNIRGIYSNDYLQKMEKDIKEIEDKAKEEGIVARFNARDQFKVRITKAHRDAWNLVPEVEYKDIELEIDEAF